MRKIEVTVPMHDGRAIVLRARQKSEEYKPAYYPSAYIGNLFLRDKEGNEKRILEVWMEVMFCRYFHPDYVFGIMDSYEADWGVIGWGLFIKGRDKYFPENLLVLNNRGGYVDYEIFSADFDMNALIAALIAANNYFAPKKAPAALFAFYGNTIMCPVDFKWKLAFMKNPLFDLDIEAPYPENFIAVTRCSENVLGGSYLTKYPAEIAEIQQEDQEEYWEDDE